MVISSFGKIDGEKPHGSRNIKSSIFGHGIVETRPMRLLTSAHPIRTPYRVIIKGFKIVFNVQDV